MGSKRNEHSLVNQMELLRIISEAQTSLFDLEATTVGSPLSYKISYIIVKTLEDLPLEERLRALNKAKQLLSELIAKD